MALSISRGGVRFWLLLLLVLLAAGAAAAVVAWRDYQRFADAPLALDGARSIDFARGTPYRELVRQLRREGIDGSPFTGTCSPAR